MTKLSSFNNADFDNYDEIFGIIEQVKKKNPFNNLGQLVQFAISLKMFSEIIIKNHNYPLFEKLFPVFDSFMKGLKATLVQDNHS
ncbi:MAG: DUF3861 family protein [Candidatus Amoebophilus sp.]